MKRYLSYLLTGILSILLLSCSEKNEDSKRLFTVTFNSMGGTEIASIKVEEGMFIIKPEDPTLEDNTFEGWFIDEEYGKEWNFEKDVVTRDITLYAKWTATSPSDIKKEDLLGYWVMTNSCYLEYDKNGELIVEDCGSTGETGDFFNLKFEENGIYHDISPYDGEQSTGLYTLDTKNKTLTLDLDEEHQNQSIYSILELNKESLAIQLKENLDEGGYYIDKRYLKKEKEM